MSYKVVLQKFEGPLDLLFHLIEKSEVDIYDIPIAEITDQYIDYLNKMEKFDLDITSEFLVMAATLLEIKSKMLLPKTKEEGKQLEFDEADPREELVKKLLEYKKFKQVAKELKMIGELNNKVFYKHKEEIEMFVNSKELSLEELSLGDLVKIFNKMIEKKLKKKVDITLREIKRDEITIEESMEKILGLLKYNNSISLIDLFDYNMSKSYIVVTFLSILELIKLKLVKVIQKYNFDDIIIKKNIRSDNRYDEQSKD